MWRPNLWGLFFGAHRHCLAGLDKVGSLLLNFFAATEKEKVMLNILNKETGEVLFQLLTETMVRADLRDADLRKADFSHADLSGALFVGADLCGADFSDAILQEIGRAHVSPVTDVSRMPSSA